MFVEKTKQFRWILYNIVLLARLFARISSGEGVMKEGVRMENYIWNFNHWSTHWFSIACSCLQSEEGSRNRLIHIFTRLISKLWKQRKTATPPRSRMSGIELNNKSNCLNSSFTAIRSAWKMVVDGANNEKWEMIDNPKSTFMIAFLFTLQNRVYKRRQISCWMERSFLSSFTNSIREISART